MWRNVHQLHLRHGGTWPPNVVETETWVTWSVFGIIFALAVWLASHELVRVKEQWIEEEGDPKAKQWWRSKVLHPTWLPLDQSKRGGTNCLGPQPVAHTAGLYARWAEVMSRFSVLSHVRSSNMQGKVVLFREVVEGEDLPVIAWPRRDAPPAVGDCALIARLRPAALDALTNIGVGPVSLLKKVNVCLEIRPQEVVLWYDDAISSEFAGVLWSSLLQRNCKPLALPPKSQVRMPQVGEALLKQFEARPKNDLCIGEHTVGEIDDAAENIAHLLRGVQAGCGRGVCCAVKTPFLKAASLVGIWKAKSLYVVDWAQMQNAACLLLESKESMPLLNFEGAVIDVKDPLEILTHSMVPEVWQVEGFTVPTHIGLKPGDAYYVALDLDGYDLCYAMGLAFGRMAFVDISSPELKSAEVLFLPPKLLPEITKRLRGGIFAHDSPRKLRSVYVVHRDPTQLPLRYELASKSN